MITRRFVNDHHRTLPRMTPLAPENLIRTFFAGGGVETTARIESGESGSSSQGNIRLVLNFFTACALDRIAVRTTFKFQAKAWTSIVEDTEATRWTRGIPGGLGVRVNREVVTTSITQLAEGQLIFVAPSGRQTGHQPTTA
jgi:hypothetical protein